MTATDSMLNALQLHELIDKIEITEDEISRMHDMVAKQQSILEKVWFTILGLDNSIITQKEKHGEDDSYVKVLRVIRDEFLKAINEPNYFKS